MSDNYVMAQIPESKFRCPVVELGAKITILHFNDVYEIEARSDEPVGGAARFATALKEFQHLNPFIVFSGDCLSPSLLSTITKGRHMIDILNELRVHCAVYGNHEFDFGVDKLEEVRTQTNFPWFLSNVYDKFTSQTLGHGIESRIIEWNGLRIGIMGLVEEEWLDTLGTIDKVNIDFIDYVVTADRLSKELRESGAELVIALTHMRWSNDIRLATEAKGLDLILGGHDHEYGVREVSGIWIVKSGSDFRHLSRVDIKRKAELTYEYSVDRIDITNVIEEDQGIKSIVDTYNDNIQYMLEDVLCHTDVDLDGRCATVRHRECNLGNLITNAMLEATHAEILPMKDLVLVVEATGQQLYECLENAVSRYPALDGRFLQVAGIQFGFDPNRQPGSRVIARSIRIQGHNLERDKKYLVAMKEYLTKGKDGYSMFTHCPQKCDLETAQVLSTIVINHFESGNIVQGLKACKSGHRMGLIKVTSSPSVTAIERSADVPVAMVPGVEGRVFHIHTESQSE
ncbi:5'-nucleotidase-like isoform X2 [Alosa sapidissima]|uniref:5'-nucleotidase-like isoform X2 n=1 Tax=Alosa sapidissima TaxID=34773 RepID=UPI001C09F23B|nr:5'-nucleotidase-like isoform X2 [Alosa sapidissima]